MEQDSTYDDDDSGQPFINQIISESSNELLCSIITDGGPMTVTVGQSIDINGTMRPVMRVEQDKFASYVFYVGD